MSIKTLFSLTTTSVILLCFIVVKTEGLVPGKANHRRSNIVNDRPIIGILTQEISYKLNQVYPGQYHSYIAASYVKFVEGAGAQVVPIWIGQTEDYYKDILSKVNGVLFPGGSTFFNHSNGYAEAGKFIYKIAKRMNKNGDWFPIWGTCLGYELLTYVAAHGVEHRTHCSAQRQALHLNFTKGFRETKMFQHAPEHVIDTLRNENSTINFHSFCVTRDDLARVSITNKFHVISTNEDWNGLQYISALEHTSMPFYGVQFHPEKNIYEWVKGKSIPHSFTSIVASQYFANFFVNEARKNNHHFSSIANERENVIYNYPTTYTGVKGSNFEECYLFQK